mmetsp:Transcript_21922/g.52175  ORF Transcript_21922/g.52175 Transcript_21922/m.52175 type:complete len:861 (+) Transcript_21922:178-2760(+)|eukprot:CAMPEP_0197177022 /NCGR_PEP_ID=MMETSP1423-20130617/2774_1 /TAXON_ID=476441 /ORGANISM="Pseudo-nitzschia heimii, Strain UNC1101" /LENGTH=860 /DNA_ID=CAMNT_0042626499 /DNA_START=79 /DNA_END=2661 /DNA_ORIENTATION=+
MKSSTAKGQINENVKKKVSTEHQPDEYRVLISKRFLFLSVLCSIWAAFAVGRMARMILLVNPQNQMLQMSRNIAEANKDEVKGGSSMPVLKTLPDPKMRDGKYPPETIYTSKTFGTGSMGSSQSRWIVTEAGKDQCVDLPEHECSAKPPFNDVQNTNGTGEIHLPAGQHLLLDIENVDGTFLNSEERLSHAMLELVSECGLTLLSYHCHKMIPMGVSCAGVLLESHVSFHTWPKEGVITLDLYTCGPNSLLPIVPLATKLFAVPKEGKGEAEEPNIVWAHKTRGYPQGDQESIVAELEDMEYFPVGKMTDYKSEIAFNATKFQHVRIYDVLRPNEQSLDAYKKSMKNDGTYESNNPELFEPDRIVYLDGVLQSRRSGEAAYHETLIHPSMFAHKNPKRVAIIGGGEGASLREVLKHRTVENVTMIEIDEIMVEVSRQYIPSWSDCSLLEGSAPSCFDDPRVEVQYRDAFQWFIDNYPTDKPALIDPFDVIIMDALDPQIQKDFVDALYDEGPFLKSIPNALSNDGIFISQVGEGATMDNAAEQYTDDKNRHRLVDTLSKLGFSTIRSYTDNGHSGFSSPWQFVIAFKRPDTKAEWFANPALVDLKIRTRSMATVDGGSPFKFFDGATMQSYYYPSKTIAEVFCRDSESRHCKEGHGFDLSRENLPMSTVELQESSIGDNAGKGVFAKVDIPSNSYIGLDEYVSSAVRGDAQTYDALLNTSKLNGGEFWGSTLNSYIDGFGEISADYGKKSFVVDSTIRSFTNHACNGNNNVGVKLGVDESSANSHEVMQEVIERHEELSMTYNPAADRQVKFHARTIALQDIKQGQEQLDNYLASSGKSVKKWESNVAVLRELCGGSSEQ